jgi:hypothetical protein
MASDPGVISRDRDYSKTSASTVCTPCCWAACAHRTAHFAASTSSRPGLRRCGRDFRLGAAGRYFEFALKNAPSSSTTKDRDPTLDHLLDSAVAKRMISGAVGVFLSEASTPR